MAETQAYPATLSIDYPEQSNRLTVAFRLFTVIPILIVWALLFGRGNNSSTSDGATVVYYGVGMVVLPAIKKFGRTQPTPDNCWNKVLSVLMGG